MQWKFGRMVAGTSLWLCAACGDDGGRDSEPMTTTTPPISTTTGVPPATTTTDPTTGGPDDSSSGEPGTSSTGPVDPSTSTGPDPTTGAPDPFCGDGVVDDGEACDDGPANADDAACTATCTVATCGDGLVHAGVETCDDGPANADDAACTAACQTAVCGDALVLAGVEVCDDGNQQDGDGCSAACLSESCGDGVVQAPEACDDGNDDETDACLPTCIAAACGDGIVQLGVEACDDMNADDTDACTTLCKPPACDDGIVSGLETDVDCGGADCPKCAIGETCLAPADCETNLCGMGVCAGTPKSCKELLQLAPMTPTGKHMLDLDGPGPIMPALYSCDMTTNGGGWTIFYAVTGANDEQPITGNAEVLAGDPLLHQHYNLGRARKVAIAATATETLYFRPDMTWLKTSAPLFDATLAMNFKSASVLVDLTESGGGVTKAFQGWANFNASGGGDFGITLSPDGPTCNNQYVTKNGFDNHNNIDYRMLNCGCERSYIYSYSASPSDGDAGYDALIALGAWKVSQGNCGAAAGEGGALKFWAAMR